MQQPRLIKKYANRRLYDTAQSTYITLEDLKQLILDGISVKIIEAKTRDDVTRLCLIQIILDQEEFGDHMFTQEILENLIRFYGNPLQAQFMGFLNNNLQIFFKQQQSFQAAFTNHTNVDMLSNLTAMNLTIWQDFMNGLNAHKPTKK